MRAAPLVEECLDRTRGRAFVLFTSYARLREVYALLRERVAFPRPAARRVAARATARLVPPDAATPCSLRPGRFGKASTSSATRSSCVIIDRLPFPSPSDPLVMARMRALEARGFDGFEQYMIPAATVRLKQGFGRLIRSTADRGVVALLDGRAAVDALRRDDPGRAAARATHRAPRRTRPSSFGDAHGLLG